MLPLRPRLNFEDFGSADALVGAPISLNQKPGAMAGFWGSVCGKAHFRGDAAQGAVNRVLDSPHSVASALAAE